MKTEHTKSDVMVVGRDPDDVLRMTSTLRASGHKVEGVSDYRDARRRVLTSPPRVLITDVRLGVYNGLQLVFCSRQAPSTRAIVLDAHFDPVIEREAARFGASYVVKSAALAEVLARVSQILTPGQRDAKTDSGAAQTASPESRRPERSAGTAA